METVDDLEELDRELRSHFAALRARRDVVSAGAPLFALEHNLDDEFLEFLKGRVREAIQSGPPSGRWPLPYIVYAAEVGYRYEDEYWPSFEASTPRWLQHGDRNWIRRVFTEFADKYGGARPTGAWGRQFSIISWPITNAILPTDLQRHLARLLADYRYRLSPDLITNPDELGLRLAGNAATTSARFRVFAQNTSLLGLVAASLLLGDESESPLLERKTLDRIVIDLSAEEESRRWLKAARDTALRLQLRGLTTSSPTSRSVGLGGGRRSVTAARVELPTLVLVRTPEGWAIQFEPPDLSPLFDRYSDLQEAVALSRPRIAGAPIRPPLARGKLLYLGLTVSIETWPEPGTTPIQLEGTDEKFNAILADECRSPFDTHCLFRLTDDPVATQVRGRQIRAGQHYVLVMREHPPDLPLWAREVSIACNGVLGFELDIPGRLQPDDLESAAHLGLGVVSELSLRPTGIEPVEWDGAGTAEWLVGEDPIIAIESTREAVRCLLIVDESDSTQLPWPPPSKEPLYARLTNLSLGEHELQVALIPPGRDSRPVSGQLRFSIREPRVRTSSGSYREALMLLSAPAAPTLEDLWEGRAALDVLGPREVPVAVTATLEGHRREALVSKRVGVRRLPIENDAWQSTFSSSFRQLPDVQSKYDLASSCLIRVSDPEIGMAEMRFDRSFVPLRWGMGRKHDQTFLRLHDNTGNDATVVEFFSFDDPDTSTNVALSPESICTNDAGGLFVARNADEVAATILPANIRTFEDFQRLGQRLPRITHRPKSPESLVHWCEQARLWMSAETRGDPIVEKTRNDVVRALSISIAAVVGGQKWSETEYALERGAPLPSFDLVATSSRDSRRLCAALSDLCHELAGRSMAERAAAFAALLAIESLRGIGRPAQGIRLRREGRGQLVIYGTPGARLSTGGVLAGSGLLDQTWFAEFALRVASAPATVLQWAGEDAMHAIQLLVDAPVVLRAARYAVLYLARTGQNLEPTVPYGGWPWE
jgi:hypothetical protein